MLEPGNDLETQDATVPVGGLVPVGHEQLDVIDLKTLERYPFWCSLHRVDYGRMTLENTAFGDWVGLEAFHSWLV